MIEGAIQLLATRGVHGASLLKVLEHTGAPRGSVYHHFPGGKDELILAALDLTGQRHDRFVDRFRGTSAPEITAGYLELWRSILVRSGLDSGCPILAVTVSASPGPLLDRAGAIFRTSQRHLVELYEEVGVPRSAAERFVTLLVAGAEGAVVLSRAQQNIAPFEVVASQLIEHAGAMTTMVSTAANHRSPATTRPEQAPTGVPGTDLDHRGAATTAADQ
jgi:AcrR family transcriptional regulator